MSIRENSTLNYFKTEDWLSLLCGCGILILGIAGLTVPALKWQSWNAAPVAFLYFGLILMASLPLVWLWSPKLKHHVVILATLFLLASAAIFLSSIEAVKKLGLEYVIFALLLGITVRQVVRLPEWFTRVSYSEYFVKAGLVLLGASVIFGDLLKAGALGLVQSLIVVLLVWYFAFWLGKWFGIEEELRLMLASAVSICGVSAAIATAGAIEGDRKKLSYVVSLVLVVAVPMLLFMPLIAHWLQLEDAVAGAWLGGTIDTTGAVVASGELLGKEALKYCTVVKFSQNILLGVAALAISIYWSFSPGKGQTKVSAAVLWERFPKFVVGFTAASLVFSFVLSSETIQHTKEYLKSFQTILFALSFASIGLETDFKALVQTGSGKPALVFLLAQLFNILLTLAVSWFLFSNAV